MKHPLQKHTKVRVIIPVLKPCGSFKRFIQVNTSIIKHTELNGSYMYTVATGDIVPQKNILSVI